MIFGLRGRFNHLPRLGLQQQLTIKVQPVPHQGLRHYLLGRRTALPDLGADAVSLCTLVLHQPKEAATLVSQDAGYTHPSTVQKSIITFT